MDLSALVRIVHLVAMALWLGAALWAPGDARRSIAAGPSQTAGLSRRIVPALRLSVWAGVATLLSGMALMLLTGAHDRIGIGVGFALTVVLLMLEMTIVLPAAKRIAAVAEAGGDLAEARAMTGKLTAMSGVAHFIWFAALVAMVLPY
jgi:hypothetical protein